MSAEEKERVAEQMERLGEAGMKQKADELEKAIEQNEVHSHTQFRRKTMTACSGKISDNGVNSLASTNIYKHCIL